MFRYSEMLTVAGIYLNFYHEIQTINIVLMFFLMWQVTVATSVKTGHLFCFTSYSKNESYEKKKEKNACSDIHSTKCSGGHGNFVKMIKNAGGGIYYLFICLFVYFFFYLFI